MLLLSLLPCFWHFQRCEIEPSSFIICECLEIAVSLVPVLVVPISIMFLFLLHGHTPLLFPALFSTRWIVCCSITLFGSHHVLTIELGLLSQLVLINNATFILARALRVGPFLLLSRSKDSVEDDPWVMHHGRNNKDILPLQTSLWGDEWSRWISCQKQTYPYSSGAPLSQWCKSSELLKAVDTLKLLCAQ